MTPPPTAATPDLAPLSLAERRDLKRILLEHGLDETLAAIVEEMGWSRLKVLGTDFDQGRGHWTHPGRDIDRATLGGAVCHELIEKRWRP